MKQTNNTFLMGRKALYLFCYTISLLLLFCAGWQIAGRSWNGSLYVHLNLVDRGTDSRSIASVPEGAKSWAFSNKGVKKGAKNQQITIVHSAEVQNLKDTIQFSLGHPLLVRAGVPVLACQNYQTIDMLWIAGEVAFHGHAPKLSMKVPCHFNPNKPSLMGPFVIPKKQILEAPLNQKLFRGPEGKSTLLFSHVQLRWPKKWILSQISFVDQNEEKIVISFSSQKEEDYFTLNLH